MDSLISWGEKTEEGRQKAGHTEVSTAYAYGWSLLERGKYIEHHIFNKGKIHVNITPPNGGAFQRVDMTPGSGREVCKVSGIGSFFGEEDY